MAIEISLRRAVTARMLAAVLVASASSYLAAENAFDHVIISGELRIPGNDGLARFSLRNTGMLGLVSRREKLAYVFSPVVDRDGTGHWIDLRVTPESVEEISPGIDARPMPPLARRLEDLPETIMTVDGEIKIWVKSISSPGDRSVQIIDPVLRPQEFLSLNQIPDDEVCCIVWGAWSICGASVRAENQVCTRTGDLSRDSSP